MQEPGHGVEPSQRPVTAPSPLLRPRAEPLLDRVSSDVSNSPEKLLLCLLEHCAEPVLEEVGFASVPQIETPGVAAVQLAHCGRQAGIRGAKDQVIVVRHEAVAETGQHVARYRTFEAMQEVDAISVELEDRLPVTPP